MFDWLVLFWLVVQSAFGIVLMLRPKKPVDAHWKTRVVPPGGTLVIVPERGTTALQRADMAAAIERWKQANPGAAAIVVAPRCRLSISERVE